MSDTAPLEEPADRAAERPRTPTVRGWFGHPAWARRVDAAGLPPEARDLVLLTVQRTKLRPKEKLAVADELIAHFHDADRQGVEPADAVRDFGNPAVAAKLIRRAKKRNRGFIWTVRRWFYGCCVMLLGFSLLLSLRFWMGEPTVRIDYLARLNAAAAALPREQRAWPEFQEAMGFRGLSTEENNLFWTYADTAPSGHADRAYEAEQVRAVLEERPAALDPLRESTRTATLGVVHELIPPVSGSGDPLEGALIHVTFNEIETLRHAATLLALDASVAAEAGEAERALADHRSMARLADWADETPTLLTGMTAIWLEDRLRKALAATLEEAPELFEPGQLADLQRLLSSGPRLDAQNLIGERLWFADLLQRMFTENGAGGGRLTPQGARILPMLVSVPSLESFGKSDAGLLLAGGRRFAASVTRALQLDRTELQRAYDGIAKAAQADLARPLWSGWGARAEQALAPLRLETDDSAGARLVLEMVGPLLNVRREAFRIGAQRDAAVLALALHRHRLATGGFPDPASGYAALVPAYLDEVPLDPLHGTPMRWTLRDGQPVVYSLGADGDDDGGVPPADGLGGNDAAFAPPEEAVDGDWVAWPPG